MKPPQYNFNVQTLIAEERVKRDDIETIKTWIKTQQEVEENEIPMELCDEQIALFLMSCDGEKENTKHTIKSYYKLKKKAPELFDCRDLVKRKDLLQQLQIL